MFFKISFFQWRKKRLCSKVNLFLIPNLLYKRWATSLLLINLISMNYFNLSWIFKSLSAATATTTYLLKMHTHRLKYTHLMFITLEINVCIRF